MADKEAKEYVIQCWGACIPDQVKGDKCGLEYNGQRHEEGETVDNIPAGSVARLLRGGKIKLAEKAAPAHTGASKTTPPPETPAKPQAVTDKPSVVAVVATEEEKPTEKAEKPKGEVLKDGGSNG